MSQDSGQTSAVVDNILRIAVATGVLAAGIVAPNIFLAIDKPLMRYFDRMDARARERELRRVLAYMKSRHMLKGDYEHGLRITEKGRARLSRVEFNTISIHPPSKWDGSWRLVFYDIPEKHKQGRDALTSKLRRLKFYQLQRSVWVCPFPCRQAIELVTDRFQVARFTSLIETNHIDQQDKLIAIFKNHYLTTRF